MLPCIAAVAIATFVGKQAYESSAYESNSLLAQNVEALSSGEDAPWFKVGSRETKDCEYSFNIGGSGTAILKLAGIKITELDPDLNGWVHYTLSEGEVICSGDGSLYCQPRNCPIAFWKQ